MTDHIDPQEFFDISDEEIDGALLFGRPMSEYSRRELAAALLAMEGGRRQERERSMERFQFALDVAGRRAPV